ncbi:hypothetical protein MKW92_047128 [Papaver armeniacum]|nr:hypothetical protein MKW92_047128 [Papaver armeniacum]
MLKNAADWKLFVNKFTFASIFKACAGLGWIRVGKAVHSYCFVSGSMIDMYSKCGSLDEARRVFDRMENRDLVAWNGMITGYSLNYFGEEAIKLFYQLQLEGFVPNGTTYTSILKASTCMLKDCSAGRYFHAKALKFGFLWDVFVGTALVDMYSKYFDMVGAEGAFQEITERNLVSFNALITGYSLAGKYEEALRIYVNLLAQNLRPDCFTFTGLFSAVSQSSNFQEGTQLHALCLKFGMDADITVGNSIVTFYSKCGFMDSALKSFEPVTRPNIVSWAGIISGLAQNGDSEKAIEYFAKCTTVASSASAKHGRHIHAFVMKIGLESNILVGSALVDVYSKFSWNSIIMGFAHHGLTSKSLLLYQEMTKSGFNPTSITFTAVLFACSHAGLVEEGIHFYETMVSYYGISPSVEHCTCLVDLLGRAGYLHEAENFLRSSPFSSDSGLWRSLLAACGVQKNIEVGVRAAKECLRLDPQDSTACVILSNIYASKQLWDEVTRIRDLMRKMGVEKESVAAGLRLEIRHHPDRC